MKIESKKTAFDYVLMVLFCGMIVMTVYPFLNVLAISLNDPMDTMRNVNFVIPRQFTLANYRFIFAENNMVQPMIMSVVKTLVGTGLGVVFTAMLAYVLSRKDFYFNKSFTIIFIVTMYVSGGMIPEYLVMRKLGLVNNMWILVVKHGMNVYNLVLMRNFFEGIPGSLYEAAKIDGCTPMGIFFKIVLPLSKAALASIGLMFSVAVWNDYATVKIYITDPDQINFQYKLRNMIMDGDTPITGYKVSQNTLYNAGIISAILPFMILYQFLQKYFVTGVNIGAVKE